MIKKTVYKEIEKKVKEIEKSESELRVVAERIKKIFDNSHDAIIIYNLGGEILDVNDKMCRMYGLTKQESYALTIKDISSPRMAIEDMPSKWQRVLKGEKLRFEWDAIRPKDKTAFNVEVCMHKIDFYGNDFVLANIRDITAHKRTEKELRDNEERFRGIVNSMSDWVWEVDSKGRYTYCSEKVEAILGYSPQEMIGKTPFDFIIPEEVKKIRKFFDDTVTKKGVIKDLDNWNISRDGHLVCLRTNGVPVLNQNGDLLGFRGVDSDITIRKQAAENLQKSEQKFKTAFRISPDAININSLKDGEYLDINEAFTKMMGYSREDVIGKTSVELNIWVDPKDRECLVSGLKKYGVFENLEADFRRKDGQIKNALMSARLLTLENEEVILSITRDVTDRKLADNVLREKEEYHRGLFENSPIALYIQDFSKVEEQIEIFKKSGITNIKHHLQTNEKIVEDLIKAVKIVQSNKAAVKLYRADSSEMLNSGFHRYIKKDDRQHFIDQIVDFTEGRDSYDCEARNNDFHGNTLDIILRKVVLNRDVNSLSKIFVSIVDITDLNKSNEEKRKLTKRLEQTQKMEAIGTLAGGIAHDFNNILFPILGHAEMLISDSPKGSPLLESLNEIYSSAFRARDLVHQILAFSRQENNELTLMKLHPIIKEALKLIRATIPTTISIDQNLQPECRPVKADPTQIHQIVMNLATNAYHAMEENGGELKVTLKEIKSDDHEFILQDVKPGSYACLTISDTGTGMDKNTMDKIFEPFFTTKKKGKGTGMGLSVVHGIVKSMSGEIQIHSEPGKSTEFHIFLPIVKSAYEKQETQTNDPIQGGTESVLLVDDEEGIIAMEKQVLERLGYHVTSRSSSIEALEAFRANPDKFDLIITDMAMPKMPGDKLAVELIKIRHDIPILLCTGFSESMSEEKIKSLGIRGLLLKPLIIRDLAQKIRESIDQSKI